MSDAKDHIRHMAVALLNALIEVNRPEGSDESYMDPTNTQRALVAVMGMLIEADPTMKTAKAMREHCEAIGKQLHAQVKVFRHEVERTGQRPWIGTAITKQ